MGGLAGRGCGGGLGMASVSAAGLAMLLDLFRLRVKKVGWRTANPPCGAGEPLAGAARLLAGFDNCGSTLAERLT